MDKRKTPKASLENKRNLFILLGLVIALAATLYAFEWKTYDKIGQAVFDREIMMEDEEIAEITEQKKPPPPPDKPPPPQTTMLEIVEDDVEIEEDVIIDAEADEEMEVEEFEPIEVEEEEEVAEKKIFMVVEQQPEFPGGVGALNTFLATNIDYPDLARESGIQGTVFVTFVVEPNGSVSATKILRGIGGGCDEEAMRVVKKMPKWKPGKQRGKPVRVQFNLPVKFILQS